MGSVAETLTVLALGAFELWVAIPAGLALGLHPLAVSVTAAIGAILGVSAVVVLGERVRCWLARRRGREAEEGRHGLASWIWRRCGIVGLGLLAPLVTGAPIGAALGLALGVPAGRLFFWMGLGAVLWSAALTLAAVLGWAGVEALAP